MAISIKKKWPSFYNFMQWQITGKVKLSLFVAVMTYLAPYFFNFMIYIVIPFYQFFLCRRF